LEAAKPWAGRGEASCEEDDEGERRDEGGENAELAEPNESCDALSERDECGTGSEPGGRGNRESCERSATWAGKLPPSERLAGTCL